MKIWLFLYLSVTLAGAFVFGTRWNARADPFEVYSVVASRMSPLRRNADGRIAIGNPFDHLLSMPVRQGTLAVLAVLLGSTAFDSFSAIPGWRQFVDDVAGDSTLVAVLVRSAGLLVVRRRGGGDVLVGGQDGRGPRRATSSRAARPDGALTHPESSATCSPTI